MDYSITVRNTKKMLSIIIILRKVQYNHYHVLGIIQYYVDIASRNLWILIMSRFYAALEIFPKFPKKRIWCFVWVPFKVLRSSVLRASGYRKDTLCSHIHTDKDIFVYYIPHIESIVSDTSFIISHCFKIALIEFMSFLACFYCFIISFTCKVELLGAFIALTWMLPESPL